MNCNVCGAILLHPINHLSPDDEQERYEVHKNDVNNKGYQNFVKPIVDAVKQDYESTSIGLDFGCGTGPVITKLLTESGYHLNLYDPFFKNESLVLEEKYDYIVCCEVMEHFNTPKKEFELLNTLLKPNGTLYCKTNLYDDSINFKSWWYKNDPTHVFMYTKKTLQWIAENFHLNLTTAGDELICFKKEL